MIEQDLRALMRQLGIVVECATVCAENVGQTGIVESADFNQMMLYLYEAGEMCRDADTGETKPRVIYPRPEMARAALRLVGSEHTHTIAHDGSGRATIIPLKRAENAK